MVGINVIALHKLGNCLGWHNVVAFDHSSDPVENSAKTAPNSREIDLINDRVLQEQSVL